MNFEIAPKETEIEAKWEDAKLYCFSLDIDGKTGWRLPTMEELTAIYKSENDYSMSYYWSSEEFNTDFAWRIGFYTGHQGRILKEASYSVRAIRNV